MFNKDINIENIYELGLLQEGLLFHALYDSSSNYYLMQFKWEYVGKLDVESLKDAWQEIINRYEILRTRFEWRNVTVPLQIVQRKISFPWHEEDWSQYQLEEQQSQLKKYLETDKSNSFDFKKDCLFRLHLIKLQQEKYIFVLTIHHILIDGWCLPIIFENLYRFYAAFAAGKNLTLDPPTPYVKYIEWLREQNKEEAYHFWQQELVNVCEPTGLGINIKKFNPHKFEGDSIQHSFNQQETAQYKEFAKRNQITLNILCQGAWATILSKYSFLNDVTYGVIISGRPVDLPDAENIVGPFINAVPIRLQLDKNLSSIQQLKELHKKNVEAYQYGYITISEIQKKSQIPQRLPLFYSLYVFENYPIKNDFLGTCEVRGMLNVSQLEIFEKTNYPLTLVISPDDELNIKISFDKECFRQEDIFRLISHFHQALNYLIQNPDTSLTKVDILSDIEKKNIISYVPTLDLCQNYTLHEMFEQQVIKTPQQIALVYEQEFLTYHQLNIRANQLAHYLQSQYQNLTGEAIEPDVLIGVCVERSIDTIVAILAILKVSGAYVPIDPDCPESRLRFILQDTNVIFLLTHQAVLRKIPFLANECLHCRTKLICLDSEVNLKIIKKFAHDNLPKKVREINLAYVIYTSGSTGKPKGVLIQHNNVVNLMLTTQQYFNFTENDVWTFFHSYAFDFSVWEMWGALLFGGKLIVVPLEIARDSLKFLQLLDQRHVTVLNQTPSAFKQLSLIEHDHHSQLTSLRYIIFGGEALNTHHLTTWWKKHGNQKPALINMYGITETTVHASYYQIANQDMDENKKNISIGRSLKSTNFYILDENQSIVPLGIPGELYIGGPGVARGYLNRKDLTDALFMSNPFQQGGKLYKTGDLIRYLPNGNFEYLGRIDQQVKLRGFRIELSEIEAVLSSLNSIKQARVILREDIPEQKRLVAYLVARQSLKDKNQEIELIKEIQNHATKHLPYYMLPNFYVFLHQMPLTINGKFDDKLLPMPDEEKLVCDNYVAPRSIAEEQLTRIWMELLKIEKVGVHDNFFDIGGHSLLAVQLISKINSVFSKNLSVVDLFENNTVAELINLINGKYLHAAASPFLIINKRAKTVPLFLVHPSSGLAFSYLPFRELLPNQNIVGISNPYFGRNESAYQSIEEMASDYVAAIKKAYPTGPYNVGGWSSGGLLAHEMARQLNSQGENIEYVLLLDAHSSETFTHQVMTEEDLRADLLEEGINPDTAEGKNFKHEVETTWKMLKQHQTKKYEGRVILLKSQQCPVPKSIDELCNGWTRFLTGPIEIYTIPGSHGKIFFHKNIMHWGPKLATTLNKPIDSILLDTTLNFIDRQLLHAIKIVDLHLLQWTLKLGANVNCINYQNIKPLHYAKEHDHKEIIQLLINAGAA